MTDSPPLHIVHVVCTDAFAGVERHIAALAADQASRGHEVEVIGGHSELITASIDNPSVHHRPARTVPQALRALQRTAKPSLINAHMTSAEVAAILSPRMAGVPVVSTRHFAQRRGSRLLSRPVVRVSARRIAAQIAVSEYVADRIDGPSTVIHAGVPTQPDAAEPLAREPVVLMAQRLEPEKATDVGIDAFAASDLPARGWRLDIAGAGRLRGALRQLAEDRGVGDMVTFLGQRDDVEARMRSAAILLAPAPIEGLGLTVLEAMAVALPVVAAAAGGHVETAGSLPDAALFGAGDVAGAALLLDRLASDADYRCSYGKALQSLQRSRFTVAAQSEATEAVYRSVL